MRHVKLIWGVSMFACFAGASGLTQAQAIEFVGKASPAMQVGVSSSLVAGVRPAQLLDTRGAAFSVVYDSQGRLKALKKTTGRNIADMNVRYDPSGRIHVVRFENGYELIFEYGVDGSQEVRDSFGGRLVRTNVAGAPLVTKSVSDRSGYLIDSLTRVERLFGFVPPVLGLNTVPTSTLGQ